MRSVFPVVVMASLACANVVRAQTNCNLPNATRQPVVLVSSGGISKGAYQAGALWAFLLLERQIRARQPAQAISIPVITGASAGNVNTLLNAIEWATPLDARRNETSSLLWQLWTGVGLDGLLPLRRYPNDSVMSVLRPEAFDPILTPLRYVRDSVPLLPCSATLGITMTRSDTSAAYKIRDIRDARVLRYVSLAGFVSHGERGFVLQVPDTSRLRRGIGVAVSAPRGSGRDSLIEFDQYIDHVRASAAFPLAFPPRQLAYSRLDSAVVQDTSGTFLDGGVFDNEPMTLGLDLLTGRDRDPARRCDVKADASPDRCLIAFVSPNRIRRPPTVGLVDDMSLLQSRAATTSARPYAIVKFAGFAGKIISAAADNELVALERRFRQAGPECAADTPSASTVCFVASSRLFPIYGATAGSFGAFIGRPLRELDFYIGAYDGLLRAVQVRCGTSPDRCAFDRLEAMLASPTELPELSQTGRSILTFLLAEERAGGRISDSRELIRSSIQDPREQDLRLLLWALRSVQAVVDSSRNDADSAAMKRADRALCAFRSVILQFFCRDGLVLALKRYSESDPPYRRPETRRQLSVNMAKAATSPDAAYFADPAFVTIAQDPEKQLYRRGRQVLFRLWQLEKRGSGLSRFAVSVVELAAGKGYENVKTSEIHMLTSAPSKGYMGRRDGFIGDLISRRLPPLAFSVQSTGRPTVMWSPLEAIFYRSMALGGTTSLGFNGDFSIGGRFQTMKSTWGPLGKVGGVALHLQSEWCPGQRCAWTGAEDVQLLFAGRSLGFGYRRVRERTPVTRGRHGLVFSINDIPALTHLIWH